MINRLSFRIPAGAALFALAFAFVASPATAQKRKSGGDELATDEKKAKNVVRPEDDAAALPSDQDPERAKQIAAKEKRLSEVRQRQLREMRNILKKNPLYKNKADLLFRIAEKEWDEAQYRYFLERADYDKQYEAWSNGTLKQKPDEPEPDYGLALVEYKKLLKEFPNYRRLDEVMYFLGRGLIQAEKKKEGASYMLRLTKEYPKSKYLTPAYLAVAEYYFDNDLLFAARTNYLKVLENQKASEFAYALYKLGYVHYNLKEYREAIKNFQSLVALSKGKDKRKIYFTNQAYSALALNYAEVDDGWKEARDYYQKQGGVELATEYLEKIARLYNAQDKTNEEIAVYEYLITANSTGKNVPEYADYITKAYKKLEDIDQTEKIITRFFGTFDPKSSWYVANKENEDSLTRANQYREMELEWLIGFYHPKAQEAEEKKKDLDTAGRYYDKAAQFYETFIKWFPDSKTIYEKQFFLAEIYFFQKKDWDQAAKNYRQVYKIDPKGKYSEDSAYAVILSAEEKMADAGLIERPERGKKKGQKGKIRKAEVKLVKTDEKCKGDKVEECYPPIPETPLHETEDGFVKACAEYSDLYPKNEKIPSIAFRSAEIYIKKGHYSEGIERLEVLMEHHSKHRFAGFAAATLFDANYRLKRWDQMERWARYMLDRRNYKVLKKNQLIDVIAVSINNYATELNAKGIQAGKDGKKAEGDELKQKAVDEWLRYVNEFGDNNKQKDKAPIALFNAAATTEGLEQTERAIELYERVIKKFPKSSQSTEAHFVLGALYESQTDFETAATYFEKMAAFPDLDDPDKTADSLYNAGAIRAALEQNPQAIAIFETYVKKFPERDDSRDMMLQIARLHEKDGRYKEADKAYDRYIKTYNKTHADTIPGIYLAKAKMYQKRGDKRARRDASKALATTLKTYKRLPEDKREDKKLKAVAAEARFLEAEYLYADFEAVKVRFPIRTLKKTLVDKAEKHQKAEKAYFEVLEYSDHSISAGALYRIGEGYYVYSKSLFDLPIPAELTEDEQFIYRAELDDVAAPLQEKGIEAAQRALQLAHKNNVYNEWSRRSATLLVKLNPDGFPVLDDAVVNSEHPVAATFSTGFIADADGKVKTMAPPKPKPKPAPATPGAPGAEDAAKKPQAQAGEGK